MPPTVTRLTPETAHIEGGEQANDVWPPSHEELATNSFLTVDEAAALLRINRKTLYEHVSAKSPGWAVRFGRTIRISREGLLLWARGNAGTALGGHT